MIYKITTLTHATMPIMLTSKDVVLRSLVNWALEVAVSVIIRADINMSGAEMKVETTIPLAICRN